MQRNGQKRDKKIEVKKTTEKNKNAQLFGQKVFNVVFELPLLRNAHKVQKKEGTYLPHLVAICQIYAAFNLFCVDMRFKPRFV
jgi:hypothetical protein